MNTNNPREGKKIGVTFSAFDLCHAGHLRMLKDCKTQCDYLIVGVQDDPSQSKDEGYRIQTGGKPKNAPVMSLAERKEIVEGIKYVDEVFVYSTEEDLLNWLRTNKYDVRILGSDWEGKKYTGWDLPHTAYFHRRDHPYSTSELRQRVYQAELQRLGKATLPNDPEIAPRELVRAKNSK